MRCECDSLEQLPPLTHNNFIFFAARCYVLQILYAHSQDRWEQKSVKSVGKSIAMGVVRDSLKFSGHPYDASHGHLCDSSELSCWIRELISYRHPACRRCCSCSLGRPVDQELDSCDFTLKDCTCCDIHAASTDLKRRTEP